MRFGSSLISRCAAVAAVGALAIAVAAPAAGATTLKLKGGTTTLTFATPAIQSLGAMGIGFQPIAPATAAAAAVSFPIRSGTLKVRGHSRKKVSGRITHRGGMSLSNQTLSIALTKPLVKLAGKTSTLDAATIVGTSPPLPITMATLDLSKAKTRVTSKRVRISGVRVKLTKLAASSMNAGFSVTGFTPGFLIGTATLKAVVKR
jgi:hypothetical protein